MRHVREIARAPHPTGSREHDRVRDYLLHELRSLGLEPSIQKTMSILGSYSTGATVENVLARVRGTGTGPALLLAAHYDSVPAGPGAGDDGAGVATLLETARAMTVGRTGDATARTDVIFLFTDGEELGLLGAAAFAAEHPWKNDVGVVLNFDNRGTRGPVLMYETSEGDLPLLRELAGGVHAPRASSLSAAVARVMPNSSDFYALRKAGMAGLNFAFIGGPQHYHTLQDTPENLDLRTLQQCGDNALPLARRLANEDLAQLAVKGGPAAVFFNPVGGWELVYPASWARAIGIALLALFAGVAAAGFTRGAVRGAGFLTALVLLLISLVAAWRVGDWFAITLSRLHGESGLPGPFMFSAIYAAAMDCLVAGITLALWEVSGVRRQEIALAGAGAWTALGVATAFRLPAASYLGVWPVVPVLAALGIVFLWRRDASGQWPAAAYVVMLLAVVPAAMLLGSLLPLLHLSLGMNEPGAPAAAALTALACWLVAAAVAPRGSSTARGAYLSLILLGAGTVLCAAGVVAVRYNDKHPRPEWVAYVRDADQGKADWYTPAGPFASTPAVPRDPWRVQYVSDRPLLSNFPVMLPGRGQSSAWTHAAPLVELDAPSAELLEETSEGDARVLRVHLRAPGGAARLSIEVHAQRLISLKLDGRDVTERTFSAAAAGRLSGGTRTYARLYDPRAQRESWNLMYAAPPEEGLELRIGAPRDSPVEVVLASIADGLPVIPGQTFAPRPASVTQQHLADATVVIKSSAF